MWQLLSVIEKDRNECEGMKQHVTRTLTQERLNMNKVFPHRFSSGKCSGLNEDLKRGFRQMPCSLVTENYTEQIF